MPSPQTFADRMDALAAALRDAGVEPERVARILGSAAAATMHALVLDAVLEENAAPPAPKRGAAPARAEPPVRLAA
jgi:hypothetical protein